MALFYKTPGVYVEEVDSGPHPIEAVGTSTAGFVGGAPNPGARVNEAVPLTSWTAFVREYVRDGDTSTPLANAVYGFFLNGGSRCYVVNTGSVDGPIAGKGIGLDQLEAIDEVAMIAAPGRIDPASYSALLDTAERLKDRVAILDGPDKVDNIDSLTKVGTVGPTAAASDDATAGAKKKAAATGALRPRNSPGGYGAFYFPWITVRDALDPTKNVSVPPSGHVAGVCADTDARRGVHKAPANVLIRGALGVSQVLARADQDVLNPAGVNCIRVLRGGVTIWGARTLDDAASNFRYFNVRRLFNMVEESIALNTNWIVFEPNDRTLWNSIVRDVTAFLMLLWRQGALVGATPAQAFFVKCDAETNPPEVVDAGQVVTVIGLAPVKPAEFVVFQVTQIAPGAQAAA
jgi:phage tail sheath protein FI